MAVYLGENQVGWTTAVIPEDYILETGTEGYWYYRKWFSGRFEAWYHRTGIETGTLTQVGSMAIYNSSAISITFPNIGITSVNHCIPSCGIEDHAYLFFPIANYVRTTGCAVILTRVGGNTSSIPNVWLDIYINGVYS